MSSHSKGLPVHGDFCGTHLRYVMSCSDAAIEAALAGLPDYDRKRLRRILRGPLQGVPDDGQKETG
jgi:hypothetical protein